MRSGRITLLKNRAKKGMIIKRWHKVVLPKVSINNILKNDIVPPFFETIDRLKCGTELDTKVKIIKIE
jgi:hypothetical protein